MDTGKNSLVEISLFFFVSTTYDFVKYLQYFFFFGGGGGGNQKYIIDLRHICLVKKLRF